MGKSDRLRRVGALWKPKPGAKSLGSGALTINGLRQRFVVLRNDRKVEGSRDPDYVLMSSDEPEVDSYTRDQHGPAAAVPQTRLIRDVDVMTTGDALADPTREQLDDIPF